MNEQDRMVLGVLTLCVFIKSLKFNSAFVFTNPISVPAIRFSFISRFLESLMLYFFHICSSDAVVNFSSRYTRYT